MWPKCFTNLWRKDGSMPIEPFKEMHRFNIVHHLKADHVVLEDGTTIYKSEKIFVPEMGGFVVCAPYGNHCIFEFPKNKPKMFPMAYGCSCGSVAVIVGSNAYGHLGSAFGAMLVCLCHTTYNKHADGSS